MEPRREFLRTAPAGVVTSAPTWILEESLPAERSEPDFFVSELQDLLGSDPACPWEPLIE